MPRARETARGGAQGPGRRAGWAPAVLGAVGLLAAPLLPGGRLASAQGAEASVYVCPMHPEVAAAAPGPCPICRMALVPGAAEARDYPVEVEPAPRAPRAGEPLRLRFTVRHPSSGAVVRDLAVVHDKPYHLFVISQDMEDYQHIHPQPQPDGALLVELRLARPGYYRLFSDFFPVGGTPQVVPGLLVTADAATDLASSRARLVPDAVLQRTAGGTTATLKLPVGGLVAGREEKLALHVADAATGAPATDIEPYLGAFGHALVMSEDTLHYVHAHPIEQLPPAGASRGGPDLTFKALLPKPGRYRIWAQVSRAGLVSTLPFTVEAASPAALAVPAARP